MTRRGLLGGAAAVAAFTVVPRHVLGGQGNTPPSGKVNVAIIGTGGQGTVNMKQLFNEPDVRIAALCDINEESDYSAWYYGGTTELKPAAELVRQKYGQACPTYHDYSEMLDKEDIDAVLLATPDHSHAMISLAVLAKHKHLYCEKPLCRTVYETRVVTEAACKGQGRPSTHFDYGGPLTEFVLMGNVALRAGKKLDFNWKKMTVTNVPDANKFVKPNYRLNA